MGDFFPEEEKDVEEASIGVHALFMGPTSILFKKKLKIVPFLVFSFNKNKLYPNGPYM